MPNYIIQGAPLPTNFKGTPQQFWEAILDRLEIASDEASFSESDTMPTSNQGPWLKDGKKWYVWDENTSTYVPLDVSDSTSNEIAIGETEPDPTKFQIWLKLSGQTFVGLAYYMGLTLGWVTPPKELQPDSVDGTMIKANSIDRDHIKNGEVTIDKLANDLPFTKFVKGGIRQFLRMDDDGGQPEWRDFLVTGSSQPLPSTSGVVSWDHGLSKTPDIIRVVLVCTTADRGYAVGDELNYSGGLSADALNPVVMANATSIKVIFGTEALQIKRLDTFATVSITTRTNWQIKVYYGLG